MCLLSCPDASSIHSFPHQRPHLDSLRPRSRTRDVKARAKEVVVHDLTDRLVPYPEASVHVH